MRLLIDMNLSPAWAAFLRDEGFEADHWSMIGSPAALDTEIMQHARENGAVILTHDLDFGAMLAAGGDRSPSVVQIRALDLSVQAIGRHLAGALHQLAGELEQGALVTVDPVRARSSLLPLSLR